MSKILFITASNEDRNYYSELIAKNINIELRNDAKDGVHGYKVFSEMQPDLCIVDTILPGASGLDLVTNIHKSKIVSNVLMITSVKNRTIIERLLRAGVNNILIKPFSDNEFLTTVKNCLELTIQE